MLDGIHHLTTLTADLDRLIGFYERVFDARVTLDLEEEGLRHVFIELGPNTVLHPFEVPGADVPQGHIPMFDRGRLDHFGLNAASETTFRELRRRVVLEGAGDGLVTDMGPYLSFDFTDPDGAGHEVMWVKPGSSPQDTRRRADWTSIEMRLTIAAPARSRDDEDHDRSVARRTSSDAPAPTRSTPAASPRTRSRSRSTSSPPTAPGLTATRGEPATAGLGNQQRAGPRAACSLTTTTPATVAPSVGGRAVPTARSWRCKRPDELIVRLADGTNVLRSSGSVPMTADGPGALRNDFVDGAGADRLRGARGSDILLGGGADPIDTVICEVFPFVESGPKRARLDDRGRATLTLHCLATAVKRCTGTLTLQRRTPGEAGTIGSRRCTVAFGDTATVRVRLARSARRAIADNQKLRAITRSREAAGHKWTSKRTLTFVR